MLIVLELLFPNICGHISSSLACMSPSCIIYISTYLCSYCDYWHQYFHIMINTYARLTILQPRMKDELGWCGFCLGTEFQGKYLKAIAAAGEDPPEIMMDDGEAKSCLPEDGSPRPPLITILLNMDQVCYSDCDGESPVLCLVQNRWWYFICTAC